MYNWHKLAWGQTQLTLGKHTMAPLKVEVHSRSGWEYVSHGHPSLSMSYEGNGGSLVGLLTRDRLGEHLLCF